MSEVWSKITIGLDKGVQKNEYFYNILGWQGIWCVADLLLPDGTHMRDSMKYGIQCLEILGSLEILGK